MGIIELVGTAIVFFGIGALVGVNNVPTVDKAVAAIKAAEQDALTTLAKIGQHRTTTPPTTSTTTTTTAV